MRKNFSIICTIMVMLVLMLGLSACGGDGGGETSDSKKTNLDYISYEAPAGLELIEKIDDEYSSKHVYGNDTTSVTISVRESEYNDLEEYIVQTGWKRDLNSYMADKMYAKIDGVLCIREESPFSVMDDVSVKAIIAGQEVVIDFVFYEEPSDTIQRTNFVNSVLKGIEFNWKKLNADDPSLVNRYDEGFTLEEAKMNVREYGSLFVKKGDLYFPLVVADYYLFAGYKKEFYYDNNIDPYMHTLFVNEKDGEKQVVKLTSGDELVDVTGYMVYDEVQKFTGDAGYTIETYPELNYEEQPYWTGTGPADQNIAETSTMDVIFVNEMFDVNGIELSNGVEVVDFEEYNPNIPIKNSQVEGLKILEAYPNEAYNKYVIPAEKGENITFGYFIEAEYKEVTYPANVKYYNLPKIVEKNNDENNWIEITYSKTKDGYLKYDTSKLENGQYSIGFGIFEVAK